MTPDWTVWRATFADRARRPLPDVTPPCLDAATRSALAHTLAVFQLGETGEGRVAHEVRTWGHPRFDEDYAEALRLFVAEEGRHARLLGHAVRALGGAPIPRDRGHAAFARARRAGGVPFELLVLLAAEVVALASYGALVVRLPESALRDALVSVCEDEADHLVFHAAFFRALEPSRAAAAAWGGLFGGVVSGALGAVAVGQAETWRRLGVSRSELVADGLRRARGAAGSAGFGRVGGERT